MREIFAETEIYSQICLAKRDSPSWSLWKQTFLIWNEGNNQILVPVQFKSELRKAEPQFILLSAHVCLHALRLSGLDRRGLISNLCLRGIMADLRLSADELRPIVQEVVRAVMDELTSMNQLVHGKLAITEEQAAELLDLNPWQLRDLRLSGKIGFTRIVGNRVRYALPDLLDYLRRNHQPGMEGR